MLSERPTPASGIREPSRLKAWKAVIAIGAAVLLSPVIALAPLVALATALPVLLFVVPVLAAFWLRGPHRSRPTCVFGRAPSEAEIAGDRRVHSSMDPTFVVSIQSVISSVDPAPTSMDPNFPKLFCHNTSFVDPRLYLGLRFAPGSGLFATHYSLT